MASGPQALLGDADAVAGSAVDPGFDDAVAGLVSGASGQVEQELGGRAIRFVVFDGPPEDPVVAELDATFGLRQLARAPEQSLWLVAGDPTRAELTDPTAPSTDTRPLGPLEVPVLTTPTTVDVELHPLTQLPRRLVVAEQAIPGGGARWTVSRWSSSPMPGGCSGRRSRPPVSCRWRTGAGGPWRRSRSWPCSSCC